MKYDMSIEAWTSANLETYESSLEGRPDHSDQIFLEAQNQQNISNVTLQQQIFSNDTYNPIDLGLSTMSDTTANGYGFPFANHTADAINTLLQSERSMDQANYTISSGTGSSGSGLIQVPDAGDVPRFFPRSSTANLERPQIIWDSPVPVQAHHLRTGENTLQTQSHTYPSKSQQRNPATISSNNSTYPPRNDDPMFAFTTLDEGDGQHNDLMNVILGPPQQNSQLFVSTQGPHQNTKNVYVKKETIDNCSDRRSDKTLSLYSKQITNQNHQQNSSSYFKDNLTQGFNANKGNLQNHMYDTVVDDELEFDMFDNNNNSKQLEDSKAQPKQIPNQGIFQPINSERTDTSTGQERIKIEDGPSGFEGRIEPPAITAIAFNQLFNECVTANDASNAARKTKINRQPALYNENQPTGRTNTNSNPNPNGRNDSSSSSLNKIEGWKIIFDIYKNAEYPKVVQHPDRGYFQPFFENNKMFICFDHFLILERKNSGEVDVNKVPSILRNEASRTLARSHEQGHGSGPAQVQNNVSRRTFQAQGAPMLQYGKYTYRDESLASSYYNAKSDSKLQETTTIHNNQKVSVVPGTSVNEVQRIYHPHDPTSPKPVKYDSRIHNSQINLKEFEGFQLFGWEVKESLFNSESAERSSQLVCQSYEDEIKVWDIYISSTDAEKDDVQRGRKLKRRNPNEELTWRPSSIYFACNFEVVKPVKISESILKLPINSCFGQINMRPANAWARCNGSNIQKESRKRKSSAQHEMVDVEEEDK